MKGILDSWRNSKKEIDMKNMLIALFSLVFVTPSFAKDHSCGKASWYAMHTKTASGERMNPALLTAAHRNLSFGTKIRVSNARTGKSVIVRVNDRGPFVKGRILDLSKGAAKEIGLIGAGTGNVCYSIVASR